MSIALTALMSASLAFAQSSHWDNQNDWKNQQGQTQGQGQTQTKPQGPVGPPMPNKIQAKQNSQNSQDLQPHNLVPPPLPPPLPLSSERNSVTIIHSSNSNNSFSTDEINKCYNLHLSIGYPKNDAKLICANQSRLRQLRTPGFYPCVSYLQGLNRPDLAPVCFHYPFTANDSGPFACLNQVLSVSDNLFWVFEDVQAFRYAHGNYAGPKYSDWDTVVAANDTSFISIPFFMKRTVEQCQVRERSNTRVKVVGEKYFHSIRAGINLDGLPLGGLSGLTMTTPGHLVAITDDKDKPSLNYFDYVVEQTAETKVTFNYTNSQKIKTSNHLDIDLEDIAYLGKDKFLISSEQGQVKEKKQETGILGMPIPAKPDSYIYELDGDRISTAYKLSDDLIPSYTKKTYECGYYRDSQGGSLAMGVSDRSRWNGPGISGPGMQNNRQQEYVKATCYSEVLSSGIQFNKGLEAMAVDLANNRLFYAPEQATIGKKDILIYQAELNGKVSNVQATYAYPIEMRNDTGLVAMKVFNENTLITMERGFSYGAREAEVKIYKVELDASTGLASKKLLVDLSSLKPQITAGFRLIDNFEGLEIGPHLNNGNILLFIVSDNNFSADQKTVLLALEVPGDLL